MSHTSPAQLERARQLLRHEGAAGTASETALAAGRTYDKLHAQLGLLLGANGVQALLVRSAKLCQSEFPFLEIAVLASSAKLSECLLAEEPATASRSAAALYGVFLTLITTFIGERLTIQALRRAWPTLEETTSREIKP